MTIHPDHEEAFQIIDAMMFSGCPSTEELDRLEYFIKRWNGEIPSARIIIQTIEEDYVEDDEDDDNKKISFGNELTGDLTEVRKYLGSIEYGGPNWITGIKGKFKICAKIFSESSTYGIKDGRISKLQICDVAQEHWGFDACYLNYDRGWDIRPTDPETLLFLNGLLEALGNDPMEGDDLFWYDIFGYLTENDYDNMTREFIFSMDCKSDAMDEAQEFVDSGEYEVVKVVSNDSEELEIVRRKNNS